MAKGAAFKKHQQKSGLSGHRTFTHELLFKQMKNRNLQQRESLLKEIKHIQKKETEILELKNTVTEIYSSANGLKSQMERSRETISELDDKMIENIQF